MSGQGLQPTLGLDWRLNKISFEKSLLLFSIDPEKM